MKNNFNIIAPFYDALARVVFSYQLDLAQQYFLEDIESNSRILIVGGGTGKVLEWLPQNSNLNIDFVERSEAMITRARKRKKNGNQVSFKTQDVLETSGYYDVIIANFFLDCFGGEKLKNVLAHTNTLLKTGGMWLVTDFAQPTNTRHRMLLWVMHSFFRLVASLESTTLQDIKGSLSAIGLKLRKEESFSKQLIFSAVYRKL